MAITPYTFDAQKAAAYLDLCFDLYRDDPNWIPPLRRRVMAQFSPEFSFYIHEGNAHIHFLATAADKPVGHVTAMVNARLKDSDNRPIGALGFFECVEDRAVAAELLGRATDWLHTHHDVRRIWGPMQFDIWHGYRFMTRGFENPTFFGEPYNKPCYPTFFASQGFAVRKRWYSVEVIGRAQLHRIADPHGDAYEQSFADGYSFVPIDVRDRESVRSLQSAIEGSYRNFLGLLPLDPDEFREIFTGYAEALDPRFAIAALGPNGRLSGFAIAYPDYGQALRAMRGRDSIVAKLRFYLHSRRMNRAVFFMIGITPQEAQRRRGLGRALFYRCLTAILDAGYESVMFALIAEDSPAWPLVGNRKDESQKEYAFYEATFER
jgi:hypothetical protein